MLRHMMVETSLLFLATGKGNLMPWTRALPSAEAATTPCSRRQAVLLRGASPERAFNREDARARRTPRPARHRRDRPNCLCSSEHHLHLSFRATEDSLFRYRRTCFGCWYSPSCSVALGKETDKQINPFLFLDLLDQATGSMDFSGVVLTVREGSFFLTSGLSFLKNFGGNRCRPARHLLPPCPAFSASRQRGSGTFCDRL